MKRLFPELPLLPTLALLFFACGPRIPLNGTDIYRSWFISPTEDRQKKLESLPLTREIIDSLVNAIRTKQSDSAHVVTLNDSQGVSYALGISPVRQYSLQKRYPLVIYLHGGIGTLKNSKGTHAWDMLAFLQDSMDIFLASPSGNRHAPWWSADGIYRILQSVRYMTIHYPVDPDRIFLCGVSDGGTGVYACASLVGSPFAGFFSISGYGGLLKQLGVPLIPENIMQRPLYNVNAGKDRLYPLNMVSTFLSWMDSQGVAVEHKEYPDESHGFDYKLQEYPALSQRIRDWRRPRHTAVSWVFPHSWPTLAPEIGRISLQQQEGTERSAFIRSHWSGDTLVVSSQRGVSSAQIAVPDGKGNSLWVQFPSQKRVRYPKKTSAFLPDFILSRAYPTPLTHSTITVQFGKE